MSIMVPAGTNLYIKTFIIIEYVCQQRDERITYQMCTELGKIHINRSRAITYLAVLCRSSKDLWLWIYVISQLFCRSMLGDIRSRVYIRSQLCKASMQRIDTMVDEITTMYANSYLIGGYFHTMEICFDQDFGLNLGWGIGLCFIFGYKPTHPWTVLRLKA